MSDHANKLRSITEKPHYLGSYERDALREAAGHIERQAERIAELEAIEHAARRLVEDGYCNDNNTQQALEAALQEVRDEHRMEW